MARCSEEKVGSRPEINCAKGSYRPVFEYYLATYYSQQSKPKILIPYHLIFFLWLCRKCSLW